MASPFFVRNYFWRVVAVACMAVHGADVQSAGTGEKRVAKALEIANIKSDYPRRKFKQDDASWLPSTDQLVAPLMETFDRRGWPSPESREKMLVILREDTVRVQQVMLAMLRDQMEPNLAEQYALRFDEEELDALLRFYRTGTGRLYAELRESISESITERQSRLGTLAEKRSVEPQALARRRAVIRTIIPLHSFPPETQVPSNVAEMHENTELAFADVVGDVLDDAARRLTPRDHELILQFHASTVGKKETQLGGTIVASIEKNLKSALAELVKPLEEKWRNAYRQLVTGNK